MKLFLLFSLIVVLQSLEDAFYFRGKNKNRYKTKYDLKLSHITGAILSLTWLFMFFYNINILGEGITNIYGFGVVVLGFMLVRIGLFNLVWSLVTKNGVYYIGNTDPLFDIPFLWIVTTLSKEIKIKNTTLKSVVVFIQKFVLFFVYLSPIICLIYGFILLNNYLS